MGVSLKNIRNLLPLVSQGLLPPRASILEYGPQNIFWSSSEQEVELAEFIKSMRDLNGLSEMDVEKLVAHIGSGGLMSDIVEQCGFGYTAIDISSYARNTILFDLNTDTVPSSMHGTFDLVTNFGTTEHILNQYNCFTTMHDFTRPGGLMYHDLPMGGYFFHGYFSYTPMFFFHLAKANDYEILYRHYWKAPGDGLAVAAPSEMTDHGWPEGWFQDWGIEFIFRKTTSQPFRLPVEIGTSGPLDEAFLGRTGEMRLIAGADGVTAPDSPQRCEVHGITSGAREPGAIKAEPVQHAGMRIPVPANRTERNLKMNDIEKYLQLFEDLGPFSGYVPRGFLADFLGGLTDANFRTMWGVVPSNEGGRFVQADPPTVSQADPFFEAAAWLDAARDACGTYTMITLGACYGGQAIGAFRALQRLNPMPAKLVAVEPDPENFAWLQKNFRDNGLDPTQHWLLNCAVSDSNHTVLFPMGSPGSGANDCTATNNLDARLNYARQIIEDPNLAERIANLIADGDTGVDTNLVPGWDFPARIKFVSAVTVADVLGPFDRVDLLEADIQGSERTAFPPAMDLIKARVKRLEIGTHGGDIHDELLQTLSARRFEIIFNYAPTTQYETPWGSFRTQDGIIVARNLDL